MVFFLFRNEMAAAPGGSQEYGGHSFGAGQLGLGEGTRVAHQTLREFIAYGSLSKSPCLTPAMND
jgi:hypothetical protein